MTIQTQTSRTFFQGYNVATTGFIYNSNGSNSATSGWIDVRSDHVLVQTCVATKNRTGSLIQRIEGKFSGYDRSASIDIRIIGNQDTIDRLITINDKVREIRVGVKSTVSPSSPLASPLTFYAGVCKTDIK